MLNHMKSNFLNGNHISWEPSKQLLIVTNRTQSSIIKTNIVQSNEREQKQNGDVYFFLPSFSYSKLQIHIFIFFIAVLLGVMPDTWLAIFNTPLPISK